MLIFHSDDYFDYLSIDGLTNASGVESEYHIKLAVKELVDNALDAGECEIGKLEENGFYVQDNGPGIDGTDEDIAYLFSINRKTYSTKGDRYPRRGAMGRGLRFVMGVVYCYKGRMTVATRGRILVLTPLKDGTKYSVVGDYQGPGTRIEIMFPESTTFYESTLEWGLHAIELSGGKIYSGPSSPHWYDEQSFYVLLNSIETNEEKIINVLKKIFGIKHQLKYRKLDDKIKQLFNSKSSKNFSESEAIAILNELQKVTKTINPKKFELVGNLKNFPYYLFKHDFFKHPNEETNIKATIPYAVEVWAKEGISYSEKDKVYFFINRTPIPITPVSFFSHKKQCIIVNININVHFSCDVPEVPLFFYVNITTPFIPRTGNSKLPKVPEKIVKDIEILFQKIIKKINREIKSPKKSETYKQDSNIALEVKSAISAQRNLLEKYFQLENLQFPEKSSLTVLRNDPFYLHNRETAVRKAQWFKDIWKKLNPEGKQIHLRRLHYKIVSQPETSRIKTHDGIPYENEDKFWNYLLEASKYARELELIDPLLIVDMRNPEPQGIFIERFDIKGDVKPMSWMLPGIDASKSGEVKLILPELEFDEKLIFNYLGPLQPVHLEIWTEKATMNDILTEICTNYKILLVQNTGYSSITGIERFLKERAFKTDKPSVILYISDYDEAGENMPIMVSRTIQHRLALEKGRGNLKDKVVAVYPIILTKEQLQQKEFQGLPKNPAKRGQGTVTELDALEAIKPGLFKKIVEENLNKYLDNQLKSKVEIALQKLKDEFRVQLNNNGRLNLKEVEDIENRLKEINHKFQPIIKKISEDINNEIEPLKEKLLSLKEEEDQISKKISEELMKKFQTMIEPKDKNLSLDDALFLSTRPYIEQTKKLVSYRTFSANKHDKTPN